MQYDRVAAGALATPVHQSVFVIRALDTHGRPCAGQRVELPTFWDSPQAIDDHPLAPNEPREVFPRVQWFTPGKIARTDIRGEVHGLFTSGSRAEPAVLAGPGDTHVQIEQVVNDNAEPFKGSDALSGTIAAFRKSPRRTRWTMYLKRGHTTIPIGGHHVELSLTAIDVEGRKLTGRVDKQGRLELSKETLEWRIDAPTSDALAQERANWNRLLALVHRSHVTEKRPGVYEGVLASALPEEVQKLRLVVDGKQIERVVYFLDGIEDWSIYEVS